MMRVCHGLVHSCTRVLHRFVCHVMWESLEHKFADAHFVSSYDAESDAGCDIGISHSNDCDVCKPSTGLRARITNGIMSIYRRLSSSIIFFFIGLFSLNSV